MSLSPATIATAIAALSPIDTNIVVKDLTSMLDEVTHRDTPVLMPAPVWISKPEYEDQSLGSGTGKAADFWYTMNYRFFYQMVGTNRKIQDVYSGLVSKTFNIIESVITNDSLATAVLIKPDSISAFGVVTDPAENEFFGCDIGLRILEFAQ